MCEKFASGSAAFRVLAHQVERADRKAFAVKSPLGELVADYRKTPH